MNLRKPPDCPPSQIPIAAAHILALHAGQWHLRQKFERLVSRNSKTGGRPGTVLGNKSNDFDDVSSCSRRLDNLRSQREFFLFLRSFAKARPSFNMSSQSFCVTGVAGPLSRPSMSSASSLSSAF